MIDLENEALVTLTEAAKLLPKRPHVSTLWRWWRVGVRGYCLETVVCGGVRYTTREAMTRFIRNLTGPSAAGRSESLNARISRREKQKQAADVACKEAGI